MVLRTISGIFLSTALLLVDSWSEFWGETMATALKKGGLTEINVALASRQTGNSLETDFTAAAIALKATSPQALKSGVLERIFTKPLRTAFGSGSFAEYGLILAKPGVPDEAKQILMRILTDARLMAAKGIDAEVHPVLVGLLAKDSLLPAFKGMVLKNLGSMQAGPAYDSLFVPYLKSNDTTLKAAAYWGVGQRIRRNRATHRNSDNAKIFSDLKGIADVSADTYVVRSLAQLGNDSARNYLVAKCAGNPEKLRTVLMNDPDLSHPGIIAEAIKAQALSGQSESLKKAIRYGVKDPKSVVTALLSDSNAKVESGLKLLKDFPELAPQFANAVDGFQDSQDAAVKSAALALQPYLNNSGSQPE